jgi:uncharacterized DUF497 family protein
MILCVEIRFQVIQHSNKLIIIFIHFCLSFNVVRVIKVREHNDFELNELETLIKETLCILMILCAEMRL